MKEHSLQQRINNFVLTVIHLTKTLPKTPENIIFFNQIIRSCSSIGANYSECIFAHTKTEFIHIINICRKETSETLYWLLLIKKCNLQFEDSLLPIIDEGEQILKIFISSVKTARKNNDK